MFKSSFSGRKSSALAKADGRGTDVSGEMRWDPHPGDTGRAGGPSGARALAPGFYSDGQAASTLLPAQSPPARLLLEPLGQVEEN